MAVQGDEDDEGDDEDDERHPAEVHLAPEGGPTIKVTHTLRLHRLVDLREPHLDVEGGDAGEGGDQGDQPGHRHQDAGGPGDCQGSGDGSVTVQGDCSQHIIGGGERECLQELYTISLIKIHTKYFASFNFSSWLKISCKAFQ